MVVGQMLVKGLKSTTFQPSKKKDERKAALLAGRGISHALAEKFAGNHFNIPVQIFYAEEMLPSQLVVLGLITPRCVNKKITPQEVTILHPIITKGFELVNSITLFPRVKVKKGQAPQAVIVIHGYAPEELREILQLGLDYFNE